MQEILLCSRPVTGEVVLQGRRDGGLNPPDVNQRRAGCVCGGRLRHAADEQVAPEVFGQFSPNGAVDFVAHAEGLEEAGQ